MGLPSRAKTRIFLSPPKTAGNEERYVREAIESNWIAPLGPFVERFEAELCGISGAKRCVALASGTSAIHLGLLAAGVRPGDLVAVSDLTFVASVNAVSYCGAKPVLVDSDPETGTMSPERLSEALERHGNKIKAVVPVHLYGMPCDMEAISALAAGAGISVVEDAAESLGSSWNGRACGTWGASGALSFNGNKIVTTSGGGALLTDDEATEARVRHLSTVARVQAPWFEHDEVGYNYRLSNLLAAVGCAQLEDLAPRVARRRALFDAYAEEMARLGAVGQREPEGAFSNRWLPAFFLPERRLRDRLCEALAAENVESRWCWKPMSLQKPYADGTASPVANDLFDRGICLPGGIEIGSEEWERVRAVLRSV